MLSIPHHPRTDPVILLLDSHIYGRVGDLISGSKNPLFFLCRTAKCYVSQDPQGPVYQVSIFIFMSIATAVCGVDAHMITLYIACTPPIKLD